MTTKSVLLIEGNPDDEALALRALKDITDEVIVARDGSEALDFLHSNCHSLPVIVVLDLESPKTGGLEVLRRLRAEPRTRLLPVVVLNTSRDEEDLINEYESGANACIHKPADVARFTEAVRQIGAYWLMVNEPPPPLRG